MKKSSAIILAIIVILVVGIGVFALTRDKDSDTGSDNSTTTTTQESAQESVNESEPPAVAEAVITYSGTGFSPDTITVTSGGSITVKNESSDTLAFRSDPHPVHTENDELNINDIAPGANRTFTLTEKGSWGYHNHLDADKTGIIVVE